MKAADLFDLIIEKAPRLRAAGVRMVELDGLRVEIDPSYAEAAPTASRYADDDSDDELEPEPLDDPATFGQRDHVPGFDLSEIDDDDDRSSER